MLVSNKRTDQERKTLVGRRIAIEAKVLRVCQTHGAVFSSGINANHAYKFGNYLFTKGRLAGQFINRREMTDAVKRALDSYSADSCSLCRRR